MQSHRKKEYMDLSIVPAVLHQFINEDSIVTRSPGRINLIGEFTDYNQGFALPAAIDKAIFLVFNSRADSLINLHSVDFNEKYSATTNDLLKSKKTSWPNYLLGVVRQFQLASVEVNGFDAAITGGVPVGAGLSSSAAVECAIALALNEATHAGFDKLQISKMAQQAENNFVGVRCGIMDQFASMFGLRDHLIKLDCRSLEFDYIPFTMTDVKIVLLDSHVKHSHGSSEYNVRRRQCEQGVELINKKYPEITSLREANKEMLSECVKPLDETIYKRCIFVLEENERLIQGCEDLKNGDIISFGKKMFEAHYGVSTMYEASCKELDFLVDSVKNYDGVIGSRMMGGGFGGCTINLVKENIAEKFIQDISKTYKLGMNKELTPYLVKIENGSTVLKRAGHSV